MQLELMLTLYNLRPQIRKEIICSDFYFGNDMFLRKVTK